MGETTGKKGIKGRKLLQKECPELSVCKGWTIPSFGIEDKGHLQEKESRERALSLEMKWLVEEGIITPYPHKNSCPHVQETV